MTVLNTFLPMKKSLKKPKAGFSFENSFYDEILKKCQELFPDRVWVDDSSIIIDSRIALQMSLSRNEDKVYFYTYLDLQDEKYEKFTVDFTFVNPYFRLFELDTIFQYLTMKSLEEKFINKNAD